MARFSILVSLLKKLFKFLCPLNDSHNRFNGPKEPREPIYTLEAFNRWNKTNKFLKVEWLEKKKAFKLLFTGFKEDPNTSKVSEHLTFTVDLQGTIFLQKMHVVGLITDYYFICIQFSKKKIISKN